MSRAAGIVAAGAFLILAAFSFDTTVLFVPGVAFVLLGCVVPPWIWLAARDAHATRTLEVDRVVEEQPLEARIDVRRGLLGLPGGEVVDELAGGAVSLSESLPRWSGRRTEVRVVARFSRRGRRLLHAPSVSVADPLGLMRIASVSRSRPQVLLVLPRTERIRWLQPEGADHPGAHSGAMSLETLAATDIDGLRPYQPGTPASRISWPALARGAGLLERRLRIEHEAGPLVVLDVRCGGPAELVDAAVRATASLALALGRRSGCDVLLPGDRRPVCLEQDLGGWNAIHARLALTEGGSDAPAPALSGAPRSGTIFYVAAERDRLPVHLTRSSMRACVLVLPTQLAPAARSIPSFEVTGCRGYVLAGTRGSNVPRERAA
jgi:uncharacterized protein (DUF58 family)